MASNYTSLWISKREPFLNLRQLLLAKETGGTDNPQQQIKFRREREIKCVMAECTSTTAERNPHYDEDEPCPVTSTTTKSSYHKSMFLFGDTSKLFNHDDENVENIDIIGSGFRDISIGTQSRTGIDKSVSKEDKNTVKDFGMDTTEMDTDEEKPSHPSAITEKVTPRENFNLALRNQIKKTLMSILEEDIDLSGDSSDDLEDCSMKPCTGKNLEVFLTQHRLKEEIESGEIPYWKILYMLGTKWEFITLWNSLHLTILLPSFGSPFKSKLSFSKEDDRILNIAISPIIRDYADKMDHLCGNIGSLISFMKMISPRIEFAKNFAEDFSDIVEYEDISLDNGFASFTATHCCEDDFNKNIIAIVRVDMNNIDKFTESSIQVQQRLGYLDPLFVREIFFGAIGDFDFFSKFVRELNYRLDNMETMG